jgi:type VI secretion system secreted protein VgrG
MTEAMMSQATQKTRRMAVQTPLGTDRLLLTGFTGREEMSRLFRYDLECVSTDFALAAKDIVGKNATFCVRRADGSTRYFNGFVRQFRAGQPTASGRYRRYRAEVAPWLWFLTRTSDCRIFQFKKVPDILAQVFTDLGFTDFDASRLRGSYPERTYCVQYRESDFDFVSRLMEEEGIFYSFQHENGKHTLVLADDKTGYRNGEDSTIDYQPTGTSHAEGETITGWEHRYSFETGKWAQTDYNFEAPQVNLMTEENSTMEFSRVKNFEEYDYPGDYEEKSDGSRLVRVRMEEEETGHDVVEGESACVALNPGEKFTLAKCAVEVENASYVTTSVEHGAYEPAEYETTASGAATDGQDAHYRNTFTCIPAGVLFRPSRTTRRPVVEGPQTAVVVGPAGEEIYPDEYGRVKVQFHWDREGQRDENSSCWIRVSQMHAGKGWGHMDIPRIGEEVIVDFLEGNPDRPIITGRVYNAGNMPPFALPAGKTRRGNTTKTYMGAGYNEMTMDDTQGAEQIRVNAQYNMDTNVNNNQALIVGVDRTAKIGNNDALKVGVDSSESVGNNKSVTVGNNMNVGVGKNLVVNAGSTITLKCGASRIFMNSGGVITITGTIITTAAAANASVVAPLTEVIGGAMLATFGSLNMLTGIAVEVYAGSLCSISGSKTDVVASGLNEIKGSIIKLN